MLPATLLGLSACKAPDAPKLGTPEVAIQTVMARDVPVEATYTGQTAGSREIEVRPRLTGILLKRNYREGHAVEPGQLMYLIDPAEFVAALKQAEAQYAQQAAVLDKARRDFTRLEPLLKEQAVSRKDVDDARSAQEQALAALQACAANVTKARLNVDYTRVTAPLGGIASLSLMSEGSLVNGPQTLLTRVVQIDPLYVMFSLPERDKLNIERLRASGSLKLPAHSSVDVKLTLADGSEFPGKGRINFADTLISQTTGSQQLRAELPNPGKKLLPGQFVKVSLQGFELKHAILIPQKAVATSAQGQFVYLVTPDGIAHARPIETAGTHGEDFVIAKGLKGGEHLIVEGLTRVRADQPVRVVTAAPTQKRG
ncbi:efflux RND transporter periplasmic adaptor subunit [Niveibacterium terrae]|uniref:efflux RND transporter periplasmic adaptor subunit n=1 Tax=Niveibacterium terrae TaxID=3373598 RepID=UPI003A952584